MKFIQHITLATFVCATIAQPVSAAIGIYNWSISSNNPPLPIQISYRLNCPGTVEIAIKDDVGHSISLDPYSETAGTHTYFWPDNVAGKRYQAEIKATCPASGNTGELVPIVPVFTDSKVYGMAVDTCETSPGYGTIYISDVSGSGSIKAYYADGTPNKIFKPDQTQPETNVLPLGFVCNTPKAPWGISVDEKGNIYVSAASSGSVSGIKVFDYLGNNLNLAFPIVSNGNTWLAGVSGTTPDKTEVFETKDRAVQSIKVGETSWQTITSDPIISSTVNAKQIAFEPGGSAFYVALSGTSALPNPPNPGVLRYTRNAEGTWVRDDAFLPGLRNQKDKYNYATAADYVDGVSYCAKPSSLTCTTSCLWLALNVGASFPGNIARLKLPDNYQVFKSIGASGRFVASDSVGNVVIEFNGTDQNAAWTKWGLYAPGGESSQDIRSTDWALPVGTASPELIDSISALLKKSNDSLVELSNGKVVSAVFAGYFYICETDRSCGIKVKSSTSAVEGDTVKVRGTLQTVDGERVLQDAIIVP